MRTTLSLFVACLISSASFADCGDITKQLFAIEIGGPRNYLSQRPTGVSLSPVKREWLNGGMDILTGMTSGLNISQAHVTWHENRIVQVLAMIKGSSDAEIDGAIHRLLTIAHTDFAPNTVPSSEYLRCSDGLEVRLSKTSLHGPQATVPIVALSITDPALKKQMQAATRPGPQYAKDLLAAAESGDARAQLLLGKSYLERNDRKEGMRWLRLASEGHNAEAKYELGKTLGIFADPESWKWLESAAIQGYDEALAYASRLMRLRLCDSPFGKRYVNFLNAIAESAQHPRTQTLAQSELKYALRFRERSPGNCD